MIDSFIIGKTKDNMFDPWIGCMRNFEHYDDRQCCSIAIMGVEHMTDIASILGYWSCETKVTEPGAMYGLKVFVKLCSH